MKFDFKQDILPHLIAIGVFVVITIAFFNPVFFENKSLSQYDIQQWEGSAKELIDFREETGQEGLWTNSMFGGMPGYLINVMWSDKPVEYLHRVYTLGLPHPVRVIFAAFLSFYILLIAFRVRPEVAVGVTLAFGLSSYMIIGLTAGHNARIGAIAYMPLIIAGVHLALQGKKWLGMGITTAGMAMHLRLNHLQITYYLLLILLVYGIIYLVVNVKKGTLKVFGINLGLLIAGVIIAVASMAGKFWSTYEYGKYSMRGKSELTSTQPGDARGLARDYAFQYSNSIFEPLVLIIPDFMGGASSSLLISNPDSETMDALRRASDQQTANQLARYSRAYWGKQAATAPYYAGAIIGFLFILGIIMVDKPIKTWLLIVFGMGIILSWGSNFSTFNYFMFDNFPLYNKFRSVTFTIVLSIFSMVLLSGLGLEALLNETNKKKAKKNLYTAFGVFGGLCLLLVLGAGLINMRGPGDLADQLPLWFTSALQDDRVSLMRGDAIRSLIFSALSFGVLWLIITEKIKVVYGAVVIGLLIMMDMWNVDSRYISKDNYTRNPSKAFFAKTDIDKAILQDTDLDFRVYNLQGAMNEARTSYYHHSLGGYHGAKLRRYQDLYENIIQDQTLQLIGKLQNGDMDFSELGVINMFNTKYFYVGSSETGVFRNPNPNGNAWLVSNVSRVGSPNEELNALKTINTKTDAIIDQSVFTTNQQTYDAKGSIKLTSYAPNKLTYNYSGDGPSLAVFSEIYYPKGWLATIDDSEVPILRVNYILRALELPSGDHTITFVFEPDAYTIGNKITAAFSILVLLVAFGGLYLSLKNKSNQGPV